MTFVFEFQIFHRTVQSFQGIHDLMCFADRNVGVVLAMDDEQGSGDPVGPSKRRQVGQQVMVHDRMAVLADSRGRDPRFAVPVETEQVRHAADVDTGGEQVGIPRQTGQGEVTTIGPAGDGQRRGSGNASLDQEFGARPYVGDGVVPAVPVVGVYERFAEARRSTDVRRENGDAGGDHGLVLR